MRSKEKDCNADVKKSYDVAYENLAVPEIRTDTGTAAKAPDASSQEETVDTIVYDEVAIPEIHIRKKTDIE